MGLYLTARLEFVDLLLLLLNTHMHTPVHHFPVASISSDDKEGQFLYQRLSIALQRFNAILLHESFVSDINSDL